MEKKLLKALLKKECFQRFKSWLKKDFFSADLADIYDVLVFAHEKYEGDLSVADLAEIYKLEKRLSVARIALVDILFKELEDENIDSIKPAIFEDVVSVLYRKSVALEIANEAIQIRDDHEYSTQNLKQLCDALTDAEDAKITERNVQYTTDLKELLTIADSKNQLAMPIPCLARTIPYIEKGNSIIIFGRPEVGKSSLVAQTTANLLRDKKSTVYISNEEPTNHIALNIVRAYFKKSEEEVRKLSSAECEQWADDAGNLHLYDGVGYAIDDLYRLCDTHEPDIIIIDQTDKIKQPERFDKNYEKLQSLYVLIREVAKRGNVPIINITQASADGEGKLNLNYSMMAGSKTDKAAEVDLIVGIGKHRTPNFEEDGIRYLTISKNKINGWHGTAVIGFDPFKCSYEEI